MILYFILFIVLLKISITFYKEGFTSISDIAFNAQKTSTDLSKGFDISKHNFFNNLNKVSYFFVYLIIYFDYLGIT